MLGLRDRSNRCLRATNEDTLCFGDFKVQKFGATGLFISFKDVGGEWGDRFVLHVQCLARWICVLGGILRSQMR